MSHHEVSRKFLARSKAGLHTNHTGTSSQQAVTIQTFSFWKAKIACRFDLRPGYGFMHHGLILHQHQWRNTCNLGANAERTTVSTSDVWAHAERSNSVAGGVQLLRSQWAS